MNSAEDLRQLLQSIDRKSYPAYKAARGSYQFGDYQLNIDHVQGDPFASPSHVTVSVTHQKAGYPTDYFKHPWRKTALEDYLVRQFSQEISHINFKARGSGKSGLIATSSPGPEVLSRTACECTEKGFSVRFEVGFPANGRTIQSGELIKMFFDFLPRCIRQVLFYRNRKPEEVASCIWLSDDQQYIRSQLKEKNLVSFVADGSILPRESGISSRPMTGEASVAFYSPESLQVTMNLPHHGRITGMGIPRGITLIVGGGYHGKSTLLKALEAGVYDHVSGDGREYVITDDTAMKLRAEDGRSIQHVDISLFINNLPNKKDTRSFSTEDASGSTSQAANVIEGIESGSSVFLIDEDTSATNFMIRDDLMQKIISREQEPITPLIERVRDLYEKAEISTVMVAGSSGAYFYIADTIIQMDHYRPLDITERTRSYCAGYSAEPIRSAPDFKLPDKGRMLSGVKAHTAASRTSGGKDRHGREERIKVRTFGIDSIQVGSVRADLRFAEQLVDREQTEALAQMIRYGMENQLFEQYPVMEIVKRIQDKMKREGLASFGNQSYGVMGLCTPREQEMFACFNRCRFQGLF